MEMQPKDGHGVIDCASCLSPLHPPCAGAVLNQAGVREQLADVERVRAPDVIPNVLLPLNAICDLCRFAFTTGDPPH